MTERRIAKAHASAPATVDPEVAALRQDFDQAEMAERDACFRYVRIGLRCLRKKEQLGHGKFMPWITAALNQARQRRANRYMQIASAFIERKQLSTDQVIALIGDAPSSARTEAEQMLLDFVGGRTQTELLAELARPRLGGAREGAGRKAQTETYLREMAEEFYDELCRSLHEDTTTARPANRYARLRIERLREISAQLRDTKRVIDSQIAKG